MHAGRRNRNQLHWDRVLAHCWRHQLLSSSPTHQLLPTALYMALCNGEKEHRVVRWWEAAGRTTGIAPRCATTGAESHCRNFFFYSHHHTLNHTHTHTTLFLATSGGFPSAPQQNQWQTSEPEFSSHRSDEESPEISPERELAGQTHTQSHTHTVVDKKTEYVVILIS